MILNHSFSQIVDSVSGVNKSNLSYPIMLDSTQLHQDYKLINYPEKVTRKESIDTLTADYNNKTHKIVRHVFNYYKSKIEVFDLSFNLIRENIFDSLRLIKAIEKNPQGKILFTYKNEAGISTTINYDESGLVWHINIFDEINEHVITTMSFDSTGRISTHISYIEKDSIIQWIYYDPKTGTKLQEYYLGDKIMPYREYYPDGSTWVEGNTFGIFPNSYVGKLSVFYPNGSLKREDIYDEKTPKFKVGTWSLWDEKGNLIKQEIYKNNELVETKEFLPKVKEKEK